MRVTNCWERLKCGREPGGGRVAEMGVCPAAKNEAADGVNRGRNAGRICWAVAGTLCGGVIQGDSAAKRLTCTSCEVFRSVRKEEGEAFLLLLPGQKYQPARRSGD